MILIITSKRDSHIGAVSRHLTQAGAKWVRINVEILQPMSKSRLNLPKVLVLYD